MSSAVIWTSTSPRVGWIDLVPPIAQLVGCDYGKYSGYQGDSNRTQIDGGIRIFSGPLEQSIYPVFNPIRDPMSTGIHAVYRLMLTVEIRMLAQHRIPCDEPAYLRIIVPRPHMHQAGIAIGAIAPCGCEHVGVRGGTGGAYSLAESVITNGTEDGLASVDYALLLSAPKYRC
jgi:hypothetical protein